MSYYKDQPEHNGSSTLRWMAMALIFMIIAAITQVVWFIMLVTKNPNTKLSFIVMVGSYLLAEYCRWCARDSEPESWKKK